MRTLHRSVAALALVMLVAGCGTSGPGDPADPSSTTMSDADVLVIGKQVAQCLRDNGVPEFPDPIVDEHHQLQLPDDMEAQLETRYPPQTLERAQQACQSLFDQLPESAIGGNGPNDADSDAPGPGDVEALRQWAACAREHGFPDWPDPKADGSFPLSGTPIAAEGKSPRMIAVFDACQQFWSGGFTFS
jgi:hypothetical protein